MQTYIQAQPIGKLLDTAFRLYRANFWPITRALAIMLVPVALLQILFPNDGLWSTVRTFIIQPVLLGVGTASAVALYHGRPWTIGDAYRQAGKRYLSVMGSMMFIGLITLIPFTAIGFAAFFVNTLPDMLRWIGLGILGLLACANVLFFSTKYAVVTPAIIGEEKRASDSMSRSWALATPHFWHTAGVAITTSVLSLLFSVLPAYMFSWLTPSIYLTTLLPTLTLFIVLPFQTITITCLYYDLRIRSEGYDIELAAQGYDPTLDPAKLATLADGAPRIN
ncbi:hypothetical protein F8S13_01475 [Chloroflexia bacterium SDU3-3]|nr:hypothetical protein F8S13_01475 [Chloroflexia bacterium SDU3-3]